MLQMHRSIYQQELSAQFDAGFDGGARITDVGNGWYRCEASFTTDSSDTAGSVLFLIADGDADITVDLDGTSSILIYGAQLEAGSSASSYIPTAGAAATRSGDEHYINVTDFPYAEADDGTLYATHRLTDRTLAYRGILGISESSGNDYVILSVNTSGGSGRRTNFVLNADNTNEFTNSPGTEPAYDARTRSAFAFSATNTNSAADGTDGTARPICHNA